MPTNVVDFSAVSEIIRDEPWQLHFWELTPDECFEQMKNPRKFIARLGVELPEKRSSPRCSTTIFSPRTPRFAPPIPADQGVQYARRQYRHRRLPHHVVCASRLRRRTAQEEAVAQARGEEGAGHLIWLR